MSSREVILNKLRQAQRPFMDAPPRPAVYVPVTSMEDTSPEALYERFKTELERLTAEVFLVENDDTARDCVLDLLTSHNTKRIAAWHFKHIPVKKLRTAIREAGYVIEHPNIQDSNTRAAELVRLETAEVGLTGVDAAAATTGTLIVSTAPGKGRIPTVLPPVHIVVMSMNQLVSRVEDWLANIREAGSTLFEQSANICFITGPSRTADIEKKLVLGVHGPKKLQVVVKRR